MHIVNLPAVIIEAEHVGYVSSWLTLAMEYNIQIVLYTVQCACA